MSELISHWIGGTDAAGASGRRGEVFDPATGEVQAHVEFAGTSEVDDAVAAARRAYPTWAGASQSARTRVLFAFRELLAARKHELARIVTDEHGKVLADAAGEVQRALESVEFACGAPQLLKGGLSENVSSGVNVYSIAQPLGVVGVISPSNFPAMVPMWFIPAALACGNTVILKPSEKDPSAANFIARLFAEAGLPDGVLNVVHGDQVAVHALLEHPNVESLSFVGSTPIAREIYESAGRTGKRVQALGGAKNHMVVLSDADLGQAADAAISAGFGAAGQRCMAVSVVVAVEDIADELVGKIATRARNLRVGDGRDADSEMGPLISAAHRDRVESYVQAGIDGGAELVVDGRDVAVAGSDAGFWLGPTVFDRVTSGMPVYTDEIFGPVLVVVRVPSYAEAVALVNANQYGNGTAIFTNDGGAARRYQTEVEVGMVGVNVPIPVPVAHYSFGGWHDSLFGDTHAYGPEGFHFFTRRKVVTQRWPESAQGGIDLGFPSSG